MSIPFNNKRQQLQFINCCIGIHDIVCTCSNPLFHSTKILLKQLAPELQKQERIQLQKCLGEETTTTKEEDPGFDIGDLENLFGEDAAEDDTATDNR